MPAILLGSISTLADTSELQRQAFNAAFAEHDLGWTWGREEYVGMLANSGGAARIAAYAAGRDQDVDAAAVHSTKSRRFQENLATADLAPRPGVVDAVRAARGPTAVADAPGPSGRPDVASRRQVAGCGQPVRP